jgi:competence ComEA-like helix-hairpin-helix protein
MGLQDRDYMRERRLRFPDVTPQRRWWHKWESWLAIAATVVGLAIATIFLIRQVGYMLPDFGPKSGSLVVNINTATEEELETVPGIGPARAAQIVARRPWKSVDDLVKLQGIGPDQLEDMRPFVTVSGETRKRKP